MSNLVLYHLTLNVGLGNYVPFKRLKRTEYLFILFLKPIIYIILVHVKMLQHFTGGLMFTSIPSYNTQY